MGFDGAGCLKWFSGDGSSVWCQWDRGGAQGGGAVMATVQGWGSLSGEERRMDRDVGRREEMRRKSG